MARKKGARSVPAQLAIGSAADLGFLLVLTAIASALVLLLGNLLFVSAPPDGVLWVAAPALAASTLACLLVSGKPKRGRHRR